jgi:hypothetical protein
VKSDDVYGKFWLCPSVQDALGAAEDGVFVVEVIKVTEEHEQYTCILFMFLWFDVLQSNALPEIQRMR